MAQISEADVKGMTDAELQAAYSRNLYLGHATRFSGLALGAGHAEAAYNSKAALDAGDTVSTEESLETQKFFADKIRDTRDKLLEYKQSADLMKAEAKTRGLTLKREPHVNEGDSLIRAGVDLKTDHHPDIGAQIDAFLENAPIPAPKTGPQATAPSEPVAQTPSTAQASGATAGLAEHFTRATKGGYKTLSLDGHAELQLLADAAQGIEGAKQVWEAQGRHWKVGDEHVPAYVSLPRGTDYDTAAGHAREHGLQVAHNPNVQGELALWNPHLAGAAGLELSVPRGAGDAKVAQAPEADAPPAHETQQQLIPGPFGVSL